MPSRYTSGALDRASVDQHHCEFHHSETSLARAVARFAEQGVKSGEAAVLITSAKRQREVKRQLGVDRAEKWISDEWLFLFDPAEFRETLFLDGMPDADRYWQSMREFLGSLSARGRRRVRIYGDISEQLWHEGNVEGVALMEELSAACSVVHGVKVFCGYHLDGFAHSSYQPLLKAVCESHDAVHESPDDSRLREAMDSASSEVLGVPLSVSLIQSKGSGPDWWSDVPVARRTVLWLQANMPSAMKRVLDRARTHYEHD